MNSYKFNLNRTYGLSIPFYFNNFIDFQINSKNQKFQIDNLNYELIDETNTNLNKHEFYLLKIYPFHNEDDAKIFFKNFEIILLTSPLEIPSSCINYPSNIQKANEYPPKDFADLTNIEYDYDLRNTVIYPIDKKGCTITGGQIKLQMNQNEEDLIKIIEKGFNYECSE